MSVSVASPAEIRQRNTFSIGLIIALSSWAMIFFTLAWGYWVFRMRTPFWFGEQISASAKAMGFFNTVVIAASSWNLSRAFKTEIVNPIKWVWSAFGLGLVFLIGQIILWQMVMASGLHWQKSIAGSFFFLLTGFHALHIVGALIAVYVLGLFWNQWQGKTISLGIKYFWDFLFYVWIVFYILVFIVQ